MEAFRTQRRVQTTSARTPREELQKATGNGPAWVLAIESQPKARVRVWDVGREKYRSVGKPAITPTTALWATAALADFASNKALITTSCRRLNLFDLRRLDTVQGVSEAGIGGSPGALRANLSDPRPKALTAKDDGRLYIVSLQASAMGKLKTIRCLDGHKEEVRWSQVSWGDFEKQRLRAVSISADAEVLFWNLSWLDIDPEEMVASHKIGQTGKQLSKSLLSLNTSDTIGDNRRKSAQAVARFQPRRLTVEKYHNFKTQVAFFEDKIDNGHLCSLTGSESGEIYPWCWGSADSIKLEEFEEPFIGHSDQISALSVDFQARLAVSGSFDRTIRLWNLDPDWFGHQEAILAGHEGSVRTVLPDFRRGRAISSSADGTLRIWNLGKHSSGSPNENADGEAGLLATLRPEDGQAPREVLASFTTGQAAIITRAGGFQLWDLEKQKCTVSVPGHPGATYAVQLGGCGPEESQEDDKEDAPHEEDKEDATALDDSNHFYGWDGDGDSECEPDPSSSDDDDDNDQLPEEVSLKQKVAKTSADYQVPQLSVIDTSGSAESLAPPDLEPKMQKTKTAEGLNPLQASDRNEQPLAWTGGLGWMRSGW
eukprot:TRINITY_DN2678_c0_g3_i1.p1 TRINITY_DN2678_c0_g3~~TRINITY_DN2678_c0_g3_i1.p1  ORF type:complete len:599 (-),score=116.77 TRINITY_DN2678_c0_g3_i1:372-2168(-)